MVPVRTPGLLPHSFNSFPLTVYRTHREKKKKEKADLVDPEAEAEAAYEQGKDRLLDFFKVKNIYEPPDQRRTVNDDILLAAEMRDFMEKRSPVIVCACCSRHHAPGDLYTGKPRGMGEGIEGPEEEMGEEEEELEREEEEEEEEEEQEEGEGKKQSGGGRRESGESKRSMLTFCLSSIPNLDLLRVDGRKDAEFPRDAFTTYREYCLQAEGIRDPINPSRAGKEHEQDETMDPYVDLCYACRHDLSGGRVPRASLVRLDPGPMPPHLLPLTIAEEQLLGLAKAVRYIFVMKPGHAKARQGDPKTKQFRFRGHLIAFPNVLIEDVAACFPMPLAEIPKHMQVINDL